MEQRLRLFENRLFWKILGPERDEENRKTRRLYTEKIYIYSSTYVIWVKK
jgi:hypothetical protein